VPEARKVQMVVVKSEQEARELKGKIESGEMTMYQAARDHSIDPGAKRNLGEIGWVTPGEGQPALDQATLVSAPKETAGPIETPAGWHLLRVTDVREVPYADLSQPGTRKRMRRAYIHEKLDASAMTLRRNDFEVYEENLTRLAQTEADMVRRLAEQAAQPGSVTQQRLQELQRAIQQ
jgi:parvulin-like peptidyl-prolyl isomerase